LTKDGVPEIILQRSTMPIGGNLEDRAVEIYTFQPNGLGKVFEEQMTLTYEEDMPSPASYKKIDIEGQSIRVSYIDFLKCEQYKQPYKYDLASQTLERCLEYVTYTYWWDAASKRYAPLYSETRIAPKGVIASAQFLISAPQTQTLSAQQVSANQPFIIIKQLEKFAQIGAQKKLETYFYVQLASGTKGYLPANAVKWLNVESAEVLNRYYNTMPLYKGDWKPDASFLTISVQ
jgi:hypothetical protein